MKSIHKFNNGRGATLCNKCSVIINSKFTNELYCKDCFAIEFAEWLIDFSTIDGYSNDLEYLLKLFKEDKNL